MNHSLLNWLDFIILFTLFGIVIAIGINAARKVRSTDDYFFANRSLPGWVVGISMMATIVSSLTFLAFPAKTFVDNWEFVPSQLMYFIPAIAGYYLFMPFYRSNSFKSAYEYLECRFGSWARIYSAFTAVIAGSIRKGLILYIVSIPIQQISMISLPWTILIIGILVSIYTIVGGLEAVIYTDVLQAASLFVGGFICLPIITGLLPGGLGQILSEANSAGKFSIGNTSFNLSETTMWSYILLFQVLFLQYFASDQTVVQRYLAMKSDKEARRGLIIGTIISLPAWAYFAFVGTSLWVFYNYFPSSAIETMEPEGIFTYFILTRVPNGLIGFVLFGILAASMSSLDSALNGTASLITNDFYRRFMHPNKSEKHYLFVGRFFTLILSFFMVIIALGIHFLRNDTILDLMSFALGLVTTGLMGILFLAFFTVRTSSRSAIFGTVGAVSMVIVWILLSSEMGKNLFPQFSNFIPSRFWIGVIPNLFLIIIAYTASYFFPERRSDNELTNLTLWTMKKNT
jgi:SSS family solute:Na+ symporter